MPYTKLQKGLFGLCSSLEGRRKARGKCPPLSQARKLAHEAAGLPERPPVRKKQRLRKLARNR